MSTSPERKAPPSRAREKYTFEQKWGEDPFTALGYAQIPTALLTYGARLGIEPAEGYLICHILQYKRTPGDEGPDQNDLAARFGRSVDRVHALLAGLEKKKYLKITYTRGELGKFTNALYDFRQLRAYLNECYYQDHPEMRPAGKRPLALPNIEKTIPQIRGAAKRSRETAETQSADPRSGDPRNRGRGVRRSAETLIESLNFEEKEEEGFASLFSEPEKNSPTAWADLPDAERAPWLKQARGELVAIHAGSGITPKTKLVEVRARNLYEASLQAK
jgi:hypothetical protein